MKKMVAEGKRRVAHYNESSEIRKGPWKAEEDEVLRNHVKKYGPRDWSSIRSKGLLQRTGKSCRLRWVNKLRPNLKNGVKFSAEEERIVIELQAQFGNKWAKIATYLSGRTDNDVKNFWSSRQKRLARILQTSAPSSSKSQKNTKQVKVPSIHCSPLEVPSLCSSTEEESASKTRSCSSSHLSNPPIQMVLPDLMQPRMLSYEKSPFQYNCTPERKPFIDPHSYLSFPLAPQMHRDFPLRLESQEFITRLGDPNFLDVFGGESALGGAAPLSMEPFCFGPETCPHIAGKVESHDIFMDDFPPIDMFDPIEPLPSPSKWSSMD